MSAIQETRIPKSVTASPRASVSIITRLMNLLSSVRFGVILLILLAAACMIGMLIMQQSVEGFDKYYSELTPAQRLVYGSIGFFDIYHTWYFNVLLMTLSLNIVLASIDRFPGAWKFFSHKKLDATRAYVLKQKQNATIKIRCESKEALVEQIHIACRQSGLRSRLTEKGGRSVVFAERGAWNRLGAYGVHVALLVIFLGFFLTAQYGRTGQMALMPGSTSKEITGLSFQLNQVSEMTMRLPFTVACTDIQQKLINKAGSLSAMNTIDWLTRIKITDETGQTEALVHLNEPYDYRGYRFFQSSFNSAGNARSISLRLKPEQNGQPLDVTLPRGGSAKLADGTEIVFQNFYSDFTLQGGQPDTASDEYNRPAAQLRVTTPAGEQKTVYAFSSDLPDGAPVGAPFGGYKFSLAGFEKAATAHILSVQHDPGRYPFYLGSALLVLTLCSVFFFSHQRVWALLEKKETGVYEVVLGGNTNRNNPGFEDRFSRLAILINGQTEKVQQS